MHKHRVGIRQLGTVLKLVAGIHPDHLAEVMKGKGTTQHEPVLVAQWNPDSVPEAERQTRWQQLWQCLNLLLPLRQAWAGSVDMSGLEALQNAPVLQAQPSGLTAAWVEALSLVLREMHAWAMALAEQGLPPPVVGYELLDEKGRVVAEAEMAWADLEVAVLLPDTGAEAKFRVAGWTCFVAVDGALPAELKDKLMEVQA